nr:MAG TPA: hypothetical protein [Caudoviricetes sp.]
MLNCKRSTCFHFKNRKLGFKIKSFNELLLSMFSWQSSTKRA